MPYLLDHTISAGTKYSRWTQNNNYDWDYLITEPELALRWGYGRTLNEKTNKTHHHKLLTSGLQNGRLDTCNPIMLFSRNAFLINKYVKDVIDDFNIGQSEIWEIEFTCPKGIPSEITWYATNITEDCLTFDCDKTPTKKYSTFGKTKYEYEIDFRKAKKEANGQKHCFYQDSSFSTELDMWVDDRFPTGTFISDELHSALKKKKITFPMFKLLTSF